MVNELVGQWLGSTKGSNDGYLVLNIEERLPLSGRIAFTDNASSMPCVYAWVMFKQQGNKIYGELSNFFAFNPQTRDLDSWEKIKTTYPAEMSFPAEGKIQGELNNGVITGEWSTNIETKGSFSISKYSLTQTAPIEISWDRFKTWVREHHFDGLIYRGQQKQHHLRTSFHRIGRNDLIQYANDDVPILQHFINAISGYNYDIVKMEDHGALLNLAQHHGYPTPLLDWTESPYVAAYFAYENVDKKNNEGKVRIFVFDSKKWQTGLLYYEAMRIQDPRPSITVKMLPAHNNSRAIPQQSIATFTNIDDIEFFIFLRSTINKEEYLRIFDLPISDRNTAMKELSIMGITHGALFPGFDGVCKSLKERYF